MSRLPSRPDTIGPFIPGSDSSGVIQLIEGEEYRYEWRGADTGSLTAEPIEVFNPDDSSGRTGRLRPGLSVGFVEATLFVGSAECAKLEIEVRSRKLSFEDEYRWMLNDVAAKMTEVVMEKFAASELVFEQDVSRDSGTLYQRFEFLQSLLKSERFQLAMHEVLQRPHVNWDEQLERVDLSRGLAGGGTISRQLAKLGLRPADLQTTGGTLPSIHRRRTDSTLDTVPNRFVKFALLQWQQVLSDMEDALSNLPQTPAISRGCRELGSAQAAVSDLLRRELFVGVGKLSTFPVDNQVLLRREGYREVFGAFLEFELAALLSWQDSESAFKAGSRDVATLYEYWAFLQLSTVVGRVLGRPFNLASLLIRRRDGLSIDLNKGKEKVISGSTVRFGRELNVDLFFNRTYSYPHGSWTRSMRPDYSLVIAPAPTEGGPIEAVVLHFDAKYRVEYLKEIIGAADDVVAGDKELDRDIRGGARRDDLLKMHAYRDAIRRTAGAYVLYPGGDQEISQRPFSEYHELLPGLGAFVLRPTAEGSATGTQQLTQFLEDVIEHLARRLTEHERSRYWLEEVFGRKHPDRSVVSEGPPRTATVLLGFVKSPEHFVWIRRTKTYNVRAVGRTGGVSADASLLHSQLVLLYCPASGELQLARVLSDPELLSSEALKATGYPKPGGPSYLCVQIGFVNATWIAQLSAVQVAAFLATSGHLVGVPYMTTWGELLDKVSSA
ncbi:MAG: DUF2357 domain-containing protein [Burkholderiales bacterium]|nr:DUF2357 domain-containing protein [Burkholderiales bacterium]